MEEIRIVGLDLAKKMETSINRGFFGGRPASGRDRALGVRLLAPAAGLSGLRAAPERGYAA